MCHLLWGEYRAGAISTSGQYYMQIITNSIHKSICISTQQNYIQLKLKLQKHEAISYPTCHKCLLFNCRSKRQQSLQWPLHYTIYGTLQHSIAVCGLSKHSTYTLPRIYIASIPSSIIILSMVGASMHR